MGNGKIKYENLFPSDQFYLEKHDDCKESIHSTNSWTKWIEDGLFPHFMNPNFICDFPLETNPAESTSLSTRRS